MSIFKPFRFISKHAIECEALNILESMKACPNYAPKFPLDASRVAEFLELDVVWDDIPNDEKGLIAARILPLERLIEINENIPQLHSGLGESTIAHEIGHWVLHINVPKVDRAIELTRKGITMPVEPLLCRNIENLQGIEWQAQYFASCLLMPRYILQEMQQHKDLTQWRNLYDIAEQLGVTISNLVHRLKDLNWIEIVEDSRQIHQKTLEPI
ncbi:ImmA/IrrE family metallo-endopeptidase [Lusitaniella coriacea LEGE 07157]|uniref:ImmA/IrrE family metallo-endopeptidase n=1 Tax=Lusitaniella coriacea LEGE 07157 TaxID=945747 RepID=A0A8J7DYC1_9CYAN|nr:ImmA/IrrE family metallo-endopeptidase [Lusitaniella coriacea]MBE9117726.1 ImmA/IrrE family metallo-endopeptidase [Lusitaniella coriacea LEGE 07157]